MFQDHWYHQSHSKWIYSGSTPISTTVLTLIQSIHHFSHSYSNINHQNTSRCGMKNATKWIYLHTIFSQSWSRQNGSKHSRFSLQESRKTPVTSLLEFWILKLQSRMWRSTTKSKEQPNYPSTPKGQRTRNTNRPKLQGPQRKRHT